MLLFIHLKKVMAIFVEFFCTPKSSIENRPLCVSKHRGSTSKTFIVVDFIDDEVGQWATDEVIGEEGYVVDEGPCFCTWNNNKYA